ncbi:caspase family protein [Larkinella soli]|uniref:caspase family protein n=1 Tax=Larkinella soli TaxID=1770527 RepID=UPI000FFB6FAB|nr:caspase family protein [Larkinella soli]
MKTAFLTPVRPLVAAAFLLGFLPGHQTNAQTFHGILIADTQDSILSSACERDLSLMHRQFVQMADALGYRLRELTLADDRFGRPELDRVLDNLNPGPHDVVFLYYSGHGYNLKDRSDRFPLLMLAKDPDGAARNPALLAIHDRLKTSRARLCITLADCCNDLIGGMRAKNRKRLPPKPVVLSDDSLKATYRRLLLETAGDVLIASSRPPQQAYAHPDSGSFYTRAFDDVLDATGRKPAGLTWNALLREVQTRFAAHPATRTRQSIYQLNLKPTGSPGGRITMADLSGAERPLPVDGRLLVEENRLSARQLADFRELTRQKVGEFQKYLTIVADPDQQDNIRELALENALKLFVPGATMQVGSTHPKTAVRAYPLEIYLRRLRNLEKKYFDIRISFYDLALVGDWAETGGGYLTTATYFQRFQGYNQKGQVMYGAKTAKQMEVDLRRREDPFFEENRWTVLLGDVRLAETTARTSP